MPTKVLMDERVKSIRANTHSLAISNVGNLYFWGTGLFGKLATPKLIIDASPSSFNASQYNSIVDASKNAFYE